MEQRTSTLQWMAGATLGIIVAVATYRGWIEGGRLSLAESVLLGCIVTFVVKLICAFVVALLNRLSVPLGRHLPMDNGYFWMIVMILVGMGFFYLDNELNVYGLWKIGATGAVLMGLVIGVKQFIDNRRKKKKR